MPINIKIDIIIVVDMLLTGFDSKYLNTLYVDKNLKYHSLIQAFSRTNRILNDTKPYGTILDFRGQKDVVDKAITLFSGEEGKVSSEIWLVAPASEVIEQYQQAVQNLEDFMQEEGLECQPDEVHNLKGDKARIAFVQNFKKIQRLKIQLDQYTDLNKEQNQIIDDLINEDNLLSFRGSYLGIVNRLKDKRDRSSSDGSSNGENNDNQAANIDFELILFNSTIIDYDYIMTLIANWTQSSKQEMTKAQLINIITSNSKFIDDIELIEDFVDTLELDTPLSEQEIKEKYEAFKAKQQMSEIDEIANRHNIDTQRLQTFVDKTIRTMIFDTDGLTALFESMSLGWKERAYKRNDLMKELKPLLEQRAAGREISGLAVYDD